jgi:antirestriction protein ArdC
MVTKETSGRTREKSPEIPSRIKSKVDVYQIVTNQIIEMLEQGTIPWSRPWQLHCPMNLVSKKAYRGINVFLLDYSTRQQGYSRPYWISYKQAQQLGGQVRKGEKSTIVVFWKFIAVKERDENGETKAKEVPFLRYYRVFNVEQCDIPDGKIPQTSKLDFNPVDQAEEIIANMPNRPGIKFDGNNRAFYSRITDSVHLPPKERFKIESGYYSTALHELIHSTGHPSRLNRKTLTESHSFGDHNYSQEELIAEMGSAFLCGTCGIERTIDNSAAYIQSWLKALKNDKRMVVRASSQAQKAADYILGNQINNNPITVN